MGALGAGYLANKAITKLTGFNPLGTIFPHTNLFGPVSLKEGGVSLGPASSYSPLGPAPSGGSSKGGMTSSLFGHSNPQEAPISLGEASKYSPLSNPEGGGKKGTEPGWNAGAENYTPIVMAQAGPDHRAYFRQGPMEV